MDKITGTVFIIDDDPSIRRSLSIFLLAHDFQVEAYASSEEFLERVTFNGIGCIILDVMMEGKSGLELQEELLNLNSQLPIIFITGQGNIQMSVQTLKKGAFDFLEKPFKDEELITSISEAIEFCRKYSEERDETRKARGLTDTLSPREIEILKYILTGMLNKHIAAQLNIAERTVKLHRHSISQKLGVKSVPEIMRIADKAGITSFDNKC